MTSDGRCYVGTLKACDQATNLVLDEAVERIYSIDVRFQLWHSAPAFKGDSYPQAHTC